MIDRANVFVIHSWDDAEDCRRLEELLRASDPALAHYTLPPERAVPGGPAEVAASIESRIEFATAVVVLNTPGLHRRPASDFEMRRSVDRGKRIVVVQPHGNFQQPVPAVLDGHVYRFATWRGDVVGRAIRGEYPYDGRVFDLAEIADRRRIVGVLAAGIAATSLLLVVDTLGSLQSLKRELAAAGIEMHWTGEDTGRVVRHAMGGALISVVLGLLTGDVKTALLVAGAGGAIGAVIGIRRTYRARLLGTSHVQVLAVEPI